MSPINYKNNNAVYLRNVCKRYDNNGPAVLENFCMNVKKGTIYGLLGSSGCGKTTVLSSIVGLQKWNSGELLVLGKMPGTIDSGIPGRKLGYMPQYIALYNQLTIREIIQFYGRVYNMTNREIAKQWNNLNSLLQLPNEFILIKDLSGGQKRRVSLALALTHSPELLVLDEPTIGLDILLRLKIWDYLYRTVKNLGATIIVTTHYIEEAKLANNIGVMRKGRLLVQDSPQNLMGKFQSKHLEDVVLQLCKMDESKAPEKPQQSSASVVDINIPGMKSPYAKNVNQEHGLMHGIYQKESGFDGCSSQYYSMHEENHQNYKYDNRNPNWETGGSGLWHSFRKMYALTIVFVLTLIRYPAFLIFILLMPSIQGSITLLTMGSIPTGMHFGIVNHELANWTVECNLPKNYSENSCDLKSLSCKYLNKLKTGGVVSLNSYNNETDALHHVQSGNIYGYLTFPNNYSQHMVDLLTLRKFALNATFEKSRIYAHLDYSDYVKTFSIVRSLFDSYLEYIKQLGQSCQVGAKEAEQPLLYRPPVYGSIEDHDIKIYIMPGVITCSILLIVCQLSSLMFISEREQGTLSRGIAAGLETVDIFAGHMITQGIVTICQIFIWNLVLKFIFGFTILGPLPLWLWFLFCFLCGVYGVALGLLMGIICKDQIESLITAVSLSIPYIFACWRGSFTIRVHGNILAILWLFYSEFITNIIIKIFNCSWTWVIASISLARFC